MVWHDFWSDHDDRLLFVLAVLIIAWVLRAVGFGWQSRTQGGYPARHTQRFARGEIDRAEYQERKQLLIWVMTEQILQLARRGTDIGIVDGKPRRKVYTTFDLDNLMKADQVVIHHKRRISIALMVAGATLLNAPAFAQELGDAKRGSVLALETCAACHGVRKGEKSINPLAPPFLAIAEVKGMSGIALNVALLSPHRAMPNIILDSQERADVIAYILSLKTD